MSANSMNNTIEDVLAEGEKLFDFDKYASLNEVEDPETTGLFGYNPFAHFLGSPSHVEHGLVVTGRSKHCCHCCHDKGDDGATTTNLLMLAAMAGLFMLMNNNNNNRKKRDVNGQSVGRIPPVDVDPEAWNAVIDKLEDFVVMGRLSVICGVEHNG